MQGKLAAFVLRLIGWQTVFTPPPGPKSVVLVYPHTSNWDFVIGALWRAKHQVFINWAGDNGDPDNFLTPNLSCAAAASGENQAGWCHQEFDQLIREARRVAEPERRAALYREALAIFHQQAPWIALAHPKQFAVLRKDVEGFVLSPLGSNNFTHVKRKP